MNCRNLLIMLFFIVGAAVYADGGKNSYNFLFVSDTHFGSAASFDAKTLDRKKIIHNIPRSDRLMPQYRALFADMAAKSDAGTAFVINGGDLVEGYAKSVGAQKKEIVDSLALMREYFKFPIYSVVGNRELAWKFGRQAFAEALLPEMGRSAGKELKEANYMVQYGPDVFIFVDYWSKERNKFVTESLKGLKTKPRYLFFVVHPGMVPSCSTKDLKLCDFLAAGYRTIILHGHTHGTSLVEYGRGKKSLVQFSISTNLRPAKDGINYRLPAVDEREKGLALFRQIRAKDNADKQKIYDTRCAPKVKRYMVWKSTHPRVTAAGYARIHVSDAGVTATVQDADLGKEPFEIPLWPIK